VFHKSADILRDSHDISSLVIDPAALQMILGVLIVGWTVENGKPLAYLRVLQRRLGGRQLRLRTTSFVGSPPERTDSVVNTQFTSRERAPSTNDKPTSAPASPHTVACFMTTRARRRRVGN
jgi:hypothetical protein